MVTGIEWLGIGLGTGGLVASILGVIFAFLARRAAKSAEQAAREARQAVARTLSSIDVERAAALIGRLKDIHFKGNWDYAVGLYPELRRTLSQIAESVPANLARFQAQINSAVPQITVMENLVRRSRYENETGAPGDISGLDDVLSDIQQTLESLQSSMMYSDESGSH